jgi:hypothetical protein
MLFSTPEKMLQEFLKDFLKLQSRFGMARCAELLTKTRRNAGR